METKILEIAIRIKELRDILGFTEEEMAQKTEVTVEEYRAYESGQRDFSFTFLYECARTFGVDIVELLTGENPKLSYYTVVRAGNGLPIRRRKGFTYQHVAYRIKDKIAEPFIVTAPYFEEEQSQPIHLSRHEGQEFDFIIKGSLKVQIEDHVEVLNPGDAIYYDSGHGHGMVATDGEECVFLAVVMEHTTSAE
jgi:transcriptional regulator with XRE-family HTH domain